MVHIWTENEQQYKKIVKKSIGQGIDCVFFNVFFPWHRTCCLLVVQQGEDIINRSGYLAEYFMRDHSVNIIKSNFSEILFKAKGDCIMNSRERVLASINHQEPDKLPFDLGGSTSSSISAIGYCNLKKEMGITEGHTRVYDVVQQLALVEDNLLDELGVDVVDIGRAFNTSDDNWHDVTLPDGSQVQFPKWFNPEEKEDGSWVYYDKDGDALAKMSKRATFFDQTYFPYEKGYPADFKNLDADMDKVLWSAMAGAPWDHGADDDFYEQLRAKAIHLRETTDKAIVMPCGCNLFEWGTFLRRMDNFVMDLAAQPKEVERLLDELMERHMAGLEKVCAAVGDVVDIIRMGDDLGMDSAPIMSPKMYQRIFKPRQQMLCDYVHKNSSMKVALHTCGAVRKLIPDFIDAGYDIINPVQTSARGMDPAELKKEFGKDITFWGGGCNTRWVLNQSTPQEVYDYCCRMIETFLPGGGFIFNQEHNILPDVPAENMLAMFRAVKSFK